MKLNLTSHQKVKNIHQFKIFVHNLSVKPSKLCSLFPRKSIKFLEVSRYHIIEDSDFIMSARPKEIAEETCPFGPQHNTALVLQDTVDAGSRIVVFISTEEYAS